MLRYKTLFVVLVSLALFADADALPPQRDIDENPDIVARTSKPAKLEILAHENISRADRGAPNRKMEIQGNNSDRPDGGRRRIYLISRDHSEDDPELYSLIWNSPSLKDNKELYDKLYYMLPSEIEDLKDKLREEKIQKIEKDVRSRQ